MNLWKLSHIKDLIQSAYPGIAIVPTICGSILNISPQVTFEVQKESYQVIYLPNSNIRFIFHSMKDALTCAYLLAQDAEAADRISRYIRMEEIEAQINYELYANEIMFQTMFDEDIGRAAN